MPKYVHRITVGDTLQPLNAILRDGNGDPLDLESYTVTATIEQEDGTVELAETATGVTEHPTQNFTADADTDLLTCKGHGVQERDQIVLATSASDLPAPLSASVTYFARDVTPNAFKLATVPGGAKVDITDAGSGTHTFYVVGSVQFDFAAAQVDTAGTYRLWFIIDSGSEDWTWPPGDDWIEVRIVARGATP